jgi:uncharacterized tellurite resistance protein B-like protein
MIGRLLRVLAGEAPAELAADEARLALAALLVRAARSDGIIDPPEVETIDAILAARYRLDPAAAASLRQAAETLEAVAPDTVRFTRTVKETVPHEERFAVVEALWAVVLADGSREEGENAYLRLTANLLGIGDRDSAVARRRAAGGGA